MSGYDGETAKVLKGKLHAREALNALEGVKHGLAGLPVAYDFNGVTFRLMRDAVRQLEEELGGVLAQANIEARKMGL
jgi:hypothetical protein